MTEQEQIDALKAQVNCLRDAALDAISFMVGGEAKAKLRDAYDATPEQCLAEVKAKAIEDAVKVVVIEFHKQVKNPTNKTADFIFDAISGAARYLREQAK